MADTFEEKLDERTDALAEEGIDPIEAAYMALAEISDPVAVDNYDPVTQKDIDTFLDNFPDLKKTFNACVTEKIKHLMEEVGIEDPEIIANEHCLKATLGNFVATTNPDINLCY